MTQPKTLEVLAAHNDVDVGLPYSFDADSMFEQVIGKYTGLPCRVNIRKVKNITDAMTQLKEYSYDLLCVGDLISGNSINGDPDNTRLFRFAHHDKPIVQIAQDAYGTSHSAEIVLPLGYWDVIENIAKRYGNGQKTEDFMARFAGTELAMWAKELNPNLPIISYGICNPESLLTYIKATRRANPFQTTLNDGKTIVAVLRSISLDQSTDSHRELMRYTAGILAGTSDLPVDVNPSGNPIRYID